MRQSIKAWKWIATLAFALLMLFGMTAKADAAGDVYTMEIIDDQIDGWDKNPEPIEETDLSYFKGCSEAEAKTWEGAPADLKTCLIYQIDEESAVSFCVFEGGKYTETITFINTKNNFLDCAKSNDIQAGYYTSSVQQSLPFKTLYIGDIEMVYNGQTVAGETGTATLSGTPDKPVLTLTDFSYTHNGIDQIGDEDGGTIYYKDQGRQELRVVLAGTNEINNTCSWNERKGNGIRLGEDAKMAFEGSGRLTITSVYYGMRGDGGAAITVNDGMVLVYGGWSGILAENTIVNGGVLYTEDTEGGGVSSSFGITNGLEEGVVIVNDGSLIARGNTKAFGSSLKVTNYVYGYGWSDYEGTQGRTGIPVGKDRIYDYHYDYEKVVFGQEPNVLSVTYDGNGATGTAPADDKTYYEGDKATVLGSGDLAKEGMTFLGWATSSKANLPDYIEGDNFIMGRKDQILYAVWRCIHNFISYDASADGATITAICSKEDCTLPDNRATLTISAAGGKYDGTTAYGATITDADSIKGDAEVHYYKANDDGTRGAALDPITAAPKGAGKYWAEITLGTEGNRATARVVYTIADADPAPTPAPAPAVTSVTVNTRTVTAKTLNSAITKAGGNKATVTTIVLGSKVKKIGKGAFKSFQKAKTLIVKTKRLKKSAVRNSLKGSKITRVKVKIGKKKTNKRYVKKYKKIFTKKNAGKKVKVSL